MSLSRVYKALWAFASSALGTVSAAVAVTPHHALGDVGTLGWLGVASTILFTTFGVFLAPNTPAPTPPQLGSYQPATALPYQPLPSAAFHTDTGPAAPPTPPIVP